MTSIAAINQENLQVVARAAQVLEKALLAIDVKVETPSSKTHSDDFIPQVPSKKKGYVPHANFKVVEKILGSSAFMPIYLSGPAGVGKTETVEQVCAKLGLKLVQFSFTSETDENDLFGGYVLVDGNMVKRDGPITAAAKAGSVLLLDEIDVAGSNSFMLQRVLEGKPFTVKKTGEYVVPADGFKIVATANTKGSGDLTGNYAHTNFLNQSFIDRFSLCLQFNYFDKETELKILKSHIDDIELATNIAEVSARIKQAYHSGSSSEVISTRRVIHLAKAISVLGFSNETVKRVLGFDSDELAKSFIDLYKVVSAPKEKATEAAKTADLDRIFKSPF